jgi:hypothetical protein
MCHTNKMLARLLLGFTFCFSSISLIADEIFSPYVDASGNISLPDDFRTTMVHLGSWFVPEGGASGFQGVARIEVG